MPPNAGPGTHRSAAPIPLPGSTDQSILGIPGRPAARQIAGPDLVVERAAQVVFGNTGYLVAAIGDFMEPHLRAEMDRRADTFDPMLERPDPQATTDVA